MSTSTDLGSPTHPARRDRVGVVRVGIGVIAAAIIAVVVNAGIALIVTSLHSGGVPVGLGPAEYAPLTVVGVLAGTAGWASVRRLARRPHRVLRVLVPAVVLVSFVPDLLLLTVGTSVLNVAGLLLMHVAVAAITVTLLARTLPLGDDSARR